MNRLTLERRQVWIYLGAISVGLAVGTWMPESRPVLEALLWPALVLMLYTTFLQVPLLHVRAALTDHRFSAAVIAGNFLVIPLLAWLLVQWLPPDPALRLGVLMVLLVPCTDWFITFSQLAGGDAPRAIAITPVNLLLQLPLLPAYLWLMAGSDLSAAMNIGHVWPAFLVVLIPLGVAAITEWRLEQGSGLARFRDTAAWWPVPLVAVVVFLIAGAHVTVVQDALGVLHYVVPVYVVFLLLAALLAKLLAKLLALPSDQGRTLAFSLGTRNSFLVLPLALALPAGWEIAVIVIVVQSLVELSGMLFYLRWVPKRLFKGDRVPMSRAR